jgi:hypothetical protein
MRTTSFPLLNGTVTTTSNNHNNMLHSQYDLPVQWGSINDVSATSAMSTAVPTAKRFRFSDLNYDSSYYQQQQQSLAATTSAAAATLAAMAASSGNSSSSSGGHSTVFGQQMNSGYGSYYGSGGYNSGGGSYAPALLPFGAHYAPAFEPAAYTVPAAYYPDHSTGNTAIAGGDTINTSATTAATAVGEGGLQFDGCVYGQIPEKPLLGSWCSHFDSLYVNDITDIALF